VTTLSRWFEVLNMTGTNESKRRAAALRGSGGRAAHRPRASPLVLCACVISWGNARYYESAIFRRPFRGCQASHDAKTGDRSAEKGLQRPYKGLWREEFSRQTYIPPSPLKATSPRHRPCPPYACLATLAHAFRPVLHGRHPWHMAPRMTHLLIGGSIPIDCVCIARLKAGPL
jgi:hypothetical protein